MFIRQYKVMLHENKVYNFEQFKDWLFDKYRSADRDYPFAYYVPIIGEFAKNNDKNIVAMIKLLLEKSEQAEILFNQDDICEMAINSFLTGKPLTKNELQVPKDSSENSELIEDVDNSNTEHEVQETTDATVSDSDTPKPKNGQRKKDTLKIPIRILNALKKRGYIESRKRPYKWIKLTTRTNEVSRVSLFDFCILMTYFDKKDASERVDFLNDNFVLGRLVESSDFGRHNDPEYKSEYYEELENLIKNT